MTEEIPDKKIQVMFVGCGSGVVSVRIDKVFDDGKWYLLLFDAKEDGHVGRSVGLNKGISQYLRSTLAMIEDELPE